MPIEIPMTPSAWRYFNQIAPVEDKLGLLVNTNSHIAYRVTRSGCASSYAIINGPITPGLYSVESKVESIYQKALHCTSANGNILSIESNQTYPGERGKIYLTEQDFSELVQELGLDFKAFVYT